MDVQNKTKQNKTRPKKKFERRTKKMHHDEASYKHADFWLIQFSISASGRSWLPDFSWHNIPKREKYTKLPQNVPNGYNVYQMAICKVYKISTKNTKWP
jgi:hypothetical protein